MKMKTMKRKSLIALLLTLVLLVPAFAEEASADTETVEALYARIAELEATVADLETRLAQYETPAAEYPADSEVITFDGGSVPLSEAQQVYRTRAEYFEMMGLNLADYADSLKEDVLQNLAEDAILVMKAREMNVYDLSEVDEAQAAADAEESFGEYIDYYQEYFFADGLTEEEIRKQTADYLATEGITLESLTEGARNSIWRERLYDAIASDITVSEEDVRKQYDEGLASAKEIYTTDPEMFEYDYAYGEIIYYFPEGYRQIEYVQLPFTAEEAEHAADLKNQLSVCEEDEQYVLQAELDDLYDAVSRRYSDAVAKAKDGTSLEEISLLFHLDEYYSLPVARTSSTVSAEFCEAAANLLLGDVSEPVRNEGGLWLMRYVSDIPSGEVSFEDLHDAILQNALDSARDVRINDTIEQWLSESNIVTHPEML